MMLQLVILHSEWFGEPVKTFNTEEDRKTYVNEVLEDFKQLETPVLILVDNADNIDILPQ